MTVIIPVCNGEHFIGRTLASVSSQTYRKIEIIVVDDGSTDGTLAIVKAAASRDSRIRFFSQSQAGVAAARNFAIARAQGSLIAPIDADDLWHAEKISRQVEAMRGASPKVGVVFCWSVIIDERDLIISSTRSRFPIEGKVLTKMVESNFLDNASAPLIRRSCLEAVGGYDSGLRQAQAQGAEDWKLYLMLAEICEFAVIPAHLVGYRQSTTAMSMNVVAMGRSIQLVRQWAMERWPVLPERHWRRQNYIMNNYLANLALRQRYFTKAALLQLRACASWQIALISLRTYIFFIRFLARSVRLKRPSWLRRKPRVFHEL